MSTKPSTVAHGRASTLARNAFGVTAASANAATPTVQSQHAATANRYRGNWPAAGLSPAANTHARFKQKCSATAGRYAIPMAASRGITWTKSPIKTKSKAVTAKPVTQNRIKLRTPDDICPGDCADSLVGGNCSVHAIRNHVDCGFAIGNGNAPTITPSCLR